MTVTQLVGFTTTVQTGVVRTMNEKVYEVTVSVAVVANNKAEAVMLAEDYFKGSNFEVKMSEVKEVK